MKRDWLSYILRFLILAALVFISVELFLIQRQLTNIRSGLFEAQGAFRPVRGNPIRVHIVGSDNPLEVEAAKPLAVEVAKPLEVEAANGYPLPVTIER